MASAGARFGMDLAAVRAVAIGAGTRRDVPPAQPGRPLRRRSRSPPASCSARSWRRSSPLAGDRAEAIAVGAAALPLIAAANVYLGATRGLKRMGPTLWVFWIGQPVVWIALAAVGDRLRRRSQRRGRLLRPSRGWRPRSPPARSGGGWRSGRTADAATRGRGARGRCATALPRAPSALLAQALFWADLFVLAHYISRPEAWTPTPPRAGSSQLILLFVTSANLVFSPFAADLHARGERARLDALFKRATRWALAATLPLAIVLFVAAAEVLEAFGPG